MKLPNGDKAIIDDEKLLDFVLNDQHRYGKDHAYLFRSLLGITAENCLVLREALRDAAVQAPATFGQPSPYGVKYEIQFPMKGPKGTYTVLSAWIIDHGASIPRLVTVYIR